jgi:outer membrane protein assembly factor BamB
MKSTRRRLLSGASAVGAAALAGCARLGSLLDPGDEIDYDGAPATHADAQFRGGLRRQGVSPSATVPTDPVVDWTVDELNTGEHTAAKASPVEVADGDVVVPGDTGEVHRISPSGEVRWSAATEATGRGIHGTPAVANDTVYVGAYDGAMYAFDLETGDRYWRTGLGGAIGSSPAYYDGLVYVAVEYPTPSGALFAVDAVDGSVVFDDRRPTNHPHSTLAIDRAAGRLVFGDNDGVLHAWRFPDLTYEWSFRTGDAIKGPVATDGERVYVGSWDEHVYAVDLSDGTERWAFEADGKVMSGPSVETATDTVYVGSHDGNLYALDRETGTERWAAGSGGAVTGCPTVTAEHVLFGSYDRRLHAVRKDDGDDAWVIDCDGVVTATPLVTDGAVYVAERATDEYLESGDGETGSLYCVRAAE